MMVSKLFEKLRKYQKLNSLMLVFISLAVILSACENQSDYYLTETNKLFVNDDNYICKQGFTYALYKNQTTSTGISSSGQMVIINGTSTSLYPVLKSDGTALKCFKVEELGT